MYYQKQGLFVCKLKNVGTEDINLIMWQEFLPENVRPLIHTIKF